MRERVCFFGRHRNFASTLITCNNGIRRGNTVRPHIAQFIYVHVQNAKSNKRDHRFHVCLSCISMSDFVFVRHSFASVFDAEFYCIGSGRNCDADDGGGGGIHIKKNISLMIISLQPTDCSMRCRVTTTARRMTEKCTTERSNFRVDT